MNTLPATTMLPLGALVRHDGRDAWICAVSHDQPARYQVTYLDTKAPQRRDQLHADALEVLDRSPKSDKRLPSGLRDWLSRGSPK